MTKVPMRETLSGLSVGAGLVETTSVDDPLGDETHGLERRLLWIVLSINLFFFAVEIVTGLIGGSMGRVADSLSGFRALTVRRRRHDR